MELYHAIKELVPDAVEGRDFIIQDDSDGKGPYIKVWRHKTAPKPTRTKLKTAYQNYLAKKAATEYRIKRATEYPPIGDQLDTIWKYLKSLGVTPDPNAGTNTVNGMLAKIEEVKSKYPKP